MVTLPTSLETLEPTPPEMHKLCCSLISLVNIFRVLTSEYGFAFLDFVDSACLESN